MIILAANAFHVPIHFVAPPVTPIIHVGYEHPNIMEVNPGAGTCSAAATAPWPCGVFNGAVHWDVAVPMDANPGGLLLETIFSQKLQQGGLVATLALIQAHMSKGASLK